MDLKVTQCYDGRLLRVMNQSLVWLPVSVVQGEDVEQVLRKAVILVAMALDLLGISTYH